MNISYLEKTRTLSDGLVDELLLDALEMSLSAQEWQPEDPDYAGLGSRNAFDVSTPSVKSWYPHVEKRGGVIGGFARADIAIGIPSEY